MNLFFLLSSRRVLAAAAVLFFLPAWLPAQVGGGAGGARAAADAAPDYLVSLRDLSIPSRARDAFQEGNRRLAKADFLHSAQQFQRAIARFADYYEAYFYLGISEMNLGQPEEAEKDFQKSLELSAGRYAQADFGLGLLWCDRGNFSDAMTPIQKGLDLDNDSWFGYYAQARALFGLDRLRDAEKSARQALARKADLADAYLLLADVHSRENSTAMVLQDLDEYIACDPDSSTRAKARKVRKKIAEKYPPALSTDTRAADSQP